MGLMKIAVVIPAYNESKRIKDVLSSLPKEIKGNSIMPLVVDDGSKDITSEVAKSVSGVKVLRHRINLGKGAAAKTGCDAACKLGADIIVLMDADGQHSPKDLPRIIAPVITENAPTLVIGARKANKDMPTTMRIGNWALAFTMNIFFGLKVKDSQSGYRAFSCSTYPKIRWASSNYAMETEMLILASKHNVVISEVEIATIYHDNYKGTTVIDGLRIFKILFKWRFAWSQVSKSLEPFSA